MGTRRSQQQLESQTGAEAGAGGQEEDPTVPAGLQRDWGRDAKRGSWELAAEHSFSPCVWQALCHTLQKCCSAKSLQQLRRSREPPGGRGGRQDMGGTEDGEATSRLPPESGPRTRGNSEAVPPTSRPPGDQPSPAPPLRVSPKTAASHITAPYVCEMIPTFTHVQRVPPA